MHICISCQSSLCCTLIYVCCGQVEKPIRGCNPLEFCAYSKKYKSEILQKHSPLCKHGIGWWHHFVKVQSDWVDDGLDVNVIILLFSQLVILPFYLIFSLIVFFFLSIGNQADGHQSHSPTIGQPPNTIPFSEYHIGKTISKIFITTCWGGSE